MAIRRTVIEVANNMKLKLSNDYKADEFKAGKQVYRCYSFGLRVKYNEKKFYWTVRKTYSDFQQLFFNLQRELNTQDLRLPPLTRKYVFTRLDSTQQLDEVHSIMQALVQNILYSKTFTALAFFEISVHSFVGDKKFKEMYVNKIGSGRRSNQIKFCNCYNYCHRQHKKWLRVGEFGIEYSNSHVESTVAEVIRFSLMFKVFRGRRHTGFKTAIRIRNEQHNIIVKTANTKERDELEAAIQEAYGNSDYFVHVSRYDSSFVERPFNTCKWYVDGQNYFSDVMDALVNAQSFVYVADWWLSPELFLKRPSTQHPDSQIATVLANLAEEGVKVYVHLYKEISFSLTLNSLHTKQSLTRRSSNINIMRHPNISLKGGVFLWSHHEKMVVVDGEIGFLGGLDLCYGRYDTQEHLLIDNEEPYRWNNIDYSNVRVADFTNVNDWKRDSIDRNKIPRMPWHDIAMCVRGSVVKDLGMHFRDMWNHAVRDVTGSGEHRRVIPLHNTTILQRFTNKLKTIAQNPVDHDDVRLTHRPDTLFIDPKHLEKNMKVDRQDNQDVNTAVKIKEESNSRLQSMVVPIFSRLLTSHFINPFNSVEKPNEDEKEAILKEKELKESEDLISSNQVLIEAVKQGIEKEISEHDDINLDLIGGSCSCQLLRSGGTWAIGRPETESSIHQAYLYQISQARRFIYIENQFFVSSTAGKPVVNTIAEALKNRILEAYHHNSPFKVIIVLPLLPGFEGSVDDANASVLRVQLHYEYQTICRGPNSLLEQLKNEIPNPHDYIQFYGLRTHALLKGMPVTEMVYVHSKLMIVDDRTVIMGSANINDRSMTGNRDSELCMIVEDRRKLEGAMNGERFEVSEFAHTLRMNIFKEHSGESQNDLLIDPLSDEFQRVWKERASINTRIYRKVFRCYPDNQIANISDISEFQERARPEQYSKLFTEIVGHLVKFPLKFLRKENLKLKISNKEYYLPDITFT